MTPEQKQTLDFIRAYIGEHGYAPCYREIMEAVGVKSKSSVHRHIEGLMKRGHLVRMPMLERGIALPNSDERAVNLLRDVHAYLTRGSKMPTIRKDVLAVRIKNYFDQHGLAQ